LVKVCLKDKTSFKVIENVRSIKEMLTSKQNCSTQDLYNKIGEFQVEIEFEVAK